MRHLLNIDKQHFSDKESENADQFVLVQASGKICVIWAHLVLLASKMKLAVKSLH